MKSLLLLALAFTSVSAQANTTCLEMNGGAISYSYVSGSESTAKGTVIGQILIMKNNSPLSVSKAFKDAAPELGGINPDFSDIKVISEQTLGSTVMKTFTAKLTLTKNPAGPAVSGISLPSQHSMKCHEVSKAPGLY